MRKEFTEELEEKLWGNHLWSPSYCVVSCGGTPLEIVRQYIEDQRVPTVEKHVKQSRSISGDNHPKRKKKLLDPPSRKGFAQDY